jgi:hypothetical protein
MFFHTNCKWIGLYESKYVFAGFIFFKETGRSFGYAVGKFSPGHNCKLCGTVKMHWKEAVSADRQSLGSFSATGISNQVHQYNSR